MKFKVDENLPVEVADLLRQAGYDATTVVEQHLGGYVLDVLARLIKILSVESIDKYLWIVEEERIRIRG
ncbi:hypothetical protein AUJ95_02720 [Candidatus Desantisbacteria bacterium CG2_30_40_21]|uniref:DUF5615 domain-containing protein n=5 Tax=unclassified Candidatus Desantisiibacteriota TaxID=3106372 RepID=A0A2M7J8W8_9BACT|nr:MAG: hypothetical protein AUJ95_02720 [Candidatus Desantisbacteria bacterium CG2_30_40_21]PIP41337.1 MAG: hypothetical protein COX18_03575 [Candidatus Desantisbacteria bacterium CG23_combo_of_CG06-09_8_20_14_all_40_23]PIX15846.1 MAG: hypothetical protein COZ71_09265 [Candidatus Desantisbacteria bacterium CG_4_8_14_3_um_filter_40_12]PIY19788.1 MAG: hypothetical protein COZ13_03490 [Candidatus Desantisbacteria bacterium CG_4_10_14_3_um_filter_40_18]PJB28179.1 MAG: hypothetical protein CO110_10